MKRNLVVAAVAAGSILNIYPSTSNARLKTTIQQPKSQHDDFLAMQGDWVNVGKDICKAIQGYELEKRKTAKI